ncbi:D-amino acid dehydrogenase [Geminicoccaceae bacterium 1502E]|nr:D-amino acid dehydrogenase [Geminicoccaceae bacterium 1502E]
MKVVVLGAGVIGVATAYWLQRQGHEVEVIERQPAAALETSFANGGIIHVGEAGPFSKPGAPTSILRWLGQEDAPMLLRYGAVPKMWRWGVEFLRNCTEARHLANRSSNLELALESLAALREIRAQTGIAYDASVQGSILICHDAKALEEAGRYFLPMAEEGLAVELVDGDRARTIEPALAGAAVPVEGGIFFPEDEAGDCHKFTQGLAAWCTAQGVRFRYGVTIERLELEAGTVRGVATDQGRIAADAVVVCMGSYSAPFLRPYGIRLPIYPVKGVTVTMPRDAWPEAPRTTILNDGYFFAVTPLGDRLRLAGSAEVAGWDTTPSPARCKAIFERACSVFPALRACYDPATAQHWAGLRPVMPHGRPAIGASRLGGLFLNTGHGHLGWTLACGSGKVLARRLTEGRAEGAGT